MIDLEGFFDVIWGMTEAGTDEIPCFFPASRENPAGPGILRVTPWTTFIAVQQVLGQLGQTGPTRNARHLGLDARRELLRNVACRSVAGPGTVGGLSTIQSVTSSRFPTTEPIHSSTEAARIRLN